MSADAVVADGIDANGTGVVAPLHERVRDLCTSGVDGEMLCLIEGVMATLLIMALVGAIVYVVYEWRADRIFHPEMKSCTHI